MMKPGRVFIHTELRMTARFFDDTDTDVDPLEVSFRTMSPTGQQVIYTYGVDDALGRTNEGDYYCDITPDESGRWYWRWQATGNDTTVATEGNFIVQYSPHFDQRRTVY